MAHDDNNIDDIKENLKRNVRMLSIRAYTLKSALSKDNEQAKPAKEQEPKRITLIRLKQKRQSKVPDDKKSDGDLSLQIEHYKDFDDEQSDVKKTDDKEKKTEKKEKSAKKNSKNKKKKYSETEEKEIRV